MRLPNLVFRDGTWNPEHDDGALVWKELADFYGWKVGTEIDLYIKDVDGNAYPYSFTVDGILDSREGADLGAYTSIVAFPLIYVWESTSPTSSAWTGMLSRNSQSGRELP